MTAAKKPTDPKRVPESRLKAIAKAREAWVVKPGQQSVQTRLRIPEKLVPVLQRQDTVENGTTWESGYHAQNALGDLYLAIAKLNRSELPSFIVGDDGVTVILGQHSVTANNQVEAALELLRVVLQTT